MMQPPPPPPQPLQPLPLFLSVKSFADVPIAPQGISASDFLAASDGLVQLFDLLGRGIFSFLQADIRSNIAGLRSQSIHDTTLEAIVTSENSHATACLLRLIRGFKLVCLALQNMQQDPTCELHVCFRKSYDQVLRQYHSPLVRSIVGLAIRAAPSRKDFYVRISQGGDIAQMDEELRKWLVGLDKIVTHMSSFLLL